MRTPSLIFLALAVATLAAGCILDTAGLRGSTTSGGGMSASSGGLGGMSVTTASVVGGTTGTGGSGGSVDAGGDVDFPDAPSDACDGTQVGPENAVAFPSLKAKTIDGDPADWGCEAPLVLDAATAAFKYGPDGRVFAVSAQVRLEWDAGWLYFFAHVTDPSVDGQDGKDPWRNDSIELYLAASSMPTADYGLLDHHYIVDHKGLSQESSPPRMPVQAPPFFEYKVKAKPGGYVVEARVQAVALGGVLSAGQKLGFDLLLNDGIDEAFYLIWAMASHGACGACTGCCCNSNGAPGDNPACDRLRFGNLTLQP